ncbi:MAG: hypothetical protein QNK03_24150 [Myxococcota bacterium]|nr:hypothetical protein [Myxococcota bacterium]
MRTLHRQRIAVTATALVLLALGAHAGHAATITSVTALLGPDNGNNADLFDDVGGVARERVSSVAVLSDDGSSFSTRFAAQVGVDAGGAGGASTTLLLDADFTVQIAVSALAGESWDLLLDSQRTGALTRVTDGPGSALTGMFGAVAAVSGATLSAGTLDLPSLGLDAGGGSGDVPFDQRVSATLSGVGPQLVTVQYAYRLGGRTVVSGNQGDEAAVRFGLDSNLSFFSAGDYPGTGGRDPLADGHFLSATLVPEPGVASSLAFGLVVLAVARRRSRPQ